MPARVVVVHDDPSLLGPLTESLRASGYDVVIFSDSMAAWDALNGADHVELLVTRVQSAPRMPHGIALAYSARARCPGLRVPFVAQPQFRADAEGSGCICLCR